MPIKATCSCGQKFTVNEALAGKRAKCTKCGDFFTVPQPDDAVDSFDSLGIGDLSDLEPSTTGKAHSGTLAAVSVKRPQSSGTSRHSDRDLELKALELELREFKHAGAAMGARAICLT